MSHSFLKCCTGLAYMNTKPDWSKPHHFTLGPRVVQSPLHAPVTGSPSRSLTLSHQYVKAGVSSNYGSRSYAQASPSGSNSAYWASHQNERNLGSVAPLLEPQGSSSLNIQDVVSRHGSYRYTSAGDRSMPQSAGTSAPFSTLGAGTYSGLSHQSQSTSGKAVPQSSSRIPSRVSSMILHRGPSAPSSSYAVISSTQSPCHRSNRESASTSSAHSSSSRFTSCSPQDAQSVHHVPKSQSQTTHRRHSSSLTQGIQASGSQSSTFPQNSYTTSSRYTPVSPYAKLAGSSLDVSSQSSSVQRRFGSQAAASSRLLKRGMGQGTSSQHAPSLSLPASSSYIQVIPSGSSWQPSRLTLSSQTSGSAMSQNSFQSRIPSRFSSMSLAGNPSRLVSTQGDRSFSGSSSQSGSISCRAKRG